MKKTLAFWTVAALTVFLVPAVEHLPRFLAAPVLVTAPPAGGFLRLPPPEKV